MFNLEGAISEWRRQMLAAGLQTPVPLEELESHLRDEIQRQMQAGVSEQTAFDSAVRVIGPAGLLKTEFARAGRASEWLGDDKATRTNRILGALWMALNLCFICKLSLWLGSCLRDANNFPQGLSKAGTLALIFSILVCLAGVFGSVSLVRGTKDGRLIIRVVASAVIFALGVDFFDGILRFGRFSPLHSHPAWVDASAILSVFTIWVLQPVRRIKLAAK